MAKKNQAHVSRNIWIIVAILAVFVVLLVYIRTKNSTATPPITTMSQEQNVFDFGNQSISLDGEDFMLKDGAYENSDKTHTAIITDETINEVGNRGAVILVDSPGGSGTFYYVVGAMHKDNKTTYSEPVSLGDRIKVTSVEVSNKEAENNGIVTVKYLMRPAGAPMSDEPTMEMTDEYAFEENGNLIPVLK